LRATYDGVVLEGDTRSDGSRYEQWRITGVSVDEAAAALDANGAVTSADVIRWDLDVQRFEVSTTPGPPGALLTPPAPNPTTGRAAFRLRLDATEAVTVHISDALGRRVAVLHDGPLAGGVDHTFGIDGAGLPAGVYVVRVAGETVRESRRVTVVR
jgi:hypothetical protein